MGRAPCCDKANVKRGPWSPEEDAILKAFIDQHGTGGNWITLPLKAGLKRCGKSCRLRWINYLRPGIKRGGFTDEEEALIYKLHANFGSRWSLIAAQLPGRTDNDIKNYWNTRMKRKISLRSSVHSNMLQLAPLIPYTNGATKLDHHHLQPSAVLPSNAPICGNQLPVEEMLQRIENSLQSCISTNSLESSSSRKSTDRTNNAAQSTIRTPNFQPYINTINDPTALAAIAAMDEAYQYVLPPLPCGMEPDFDISEKAQSFHLDRNTQTPDQTAIDDALKQYLTAHLMMANKNYCSSLKEEKTFMDFTRLNPLVSPTDHQPDQPLVWRGWSPRF